VLHWISCSRRHHGGEWRVLVRLFDVADFRSAGTDLAVLLLQSLVATDNFQHILRVLNTNVDGKQNIMYAMTSIKGLGRRFSNIVCKKAEVDLKKRCATFLCVLVLASYTA